MLVALGDRHRVGLTLTGRPSRGRPPDAWWVLGIPGGGGPTTRVSSAGGQVDSGAALAEWCRTDGASGSACLPSMAAPRRAPVLSVARGRRRHGTAAGGCGAGAPPVGGSVGNGCSR